MIPRIPLSRPPASVFLVFLLSLLLFVEVRSQTTTGAAVGVPWVGEKGITETVADIDEREQRLSRGPFTQLREPRPEPKVLRPARQANPESEALSQWPPSDQLPRISDVLPAPPQTIGVTFRGIRASESGYVPPDCNGAVGPTQVLVVANGRIKVFDKSGNVGGLNADLDVFFNSVRGTTGTTDPHVRYDRISGRFFVVCINLSTPNRVLLAVSSGSTITSSSSFTFYQFRHDQVGPTPNSDSNAFADYPTLGVDASAVYIGVNVFNASGTSVIGTTAFVVRKSSVLSGGPIVVTAFRQIGGANNAGPGPWAPQGADNDDPLATEGYFIGPDYLEFGLLSIRRITDPGGTPSISDTIRLNVPLTSFPKTVPALGSTQPLDALDDLLYAAQLKKGRLWTAHNIQVNSSGIASASGGRNGSRWYEISNLSTRPTLVQSGTLYDPSATNPIHYWIPSVAVNAQGHMALGCSRAGAAHRAEIAVAGRLMSDALGTIQSPILAQTTTYAYNAQTSGTQRWGDFSQVVIDPTDDMTMWTFQEYCDTTNSWGLRVIQLLAPPPATPSSATPPSISAGSSNASVVIAGSIASGSGFFDPGASFPNRISASVNGGGVTVNSVSYTSPTSITLNLNVAANATSNARTVTVTNPDGQSVTSTTGILSITGGCPVLTISPVSLPGGSAGTPYNETLTASEGTGPYTFAVTIGSLPGGLTLSSNGNLSGTPVAGNYNFTVTATDNNGCFGNRSYLLSIAGCPAFTLSPATMPNGTVGQAYSRSVTTSGGTPSYTYSNTGTLPTGLTLSAGGVLSGIPSSAGMFEFTITSTDAHGCFDSRIYTVTIHASVGNAVNLVELSSSYGQDFNALASSGSSSTLPVGWLFSESGTNANGSYTAGNGSSNTGDTYSFGSTGSNERSFGTLRSSTLISTIGVKFVNNTGETITSIAVSYTGEQWRLGAIGRADRLDFQLSTNASSLTTGDWADYDALDFSSPFTTSGTGARDGNASDNRSSVNATITGLEIPQGTSFYFRWLDIDVAGSDDGLAIDDLSLIPYSATSMTNPIGSGLANPSMVSVGGTSLLTVAVTPGANPTSTGLTVSGNLSTINGGASQPFFDDGTNGDLTAGDNTFSFEFTIPGGTATGAKTLPISVSDAQGRSGSASISLTVTRPPCPSLSISPETIPSGIAGVAYSESLNVSGGTGPYVFSIRSGALPAGMTLSQSGKLIGSPSATGKFSFEVEVLDQDSCGASKNYNLQIDCPAIMLQPETLAQAITAVPYNEVLSPTAGIGPFTFSIPDGSLPSGISLSTTGEFWGTTIAVGSYPFTVGVVDKNGCSGEQDYLIEVEAAPIVSKTLPIKGRWNLLSTPLWLIEDSVQNVFPKAISPAFSYSVVGGYVPEARLSIGSGYWLRFADDQDVKMSGYSISSDTLDVQAGWNLIGSLSSPVSVSSLVPVGATILSRVFEFAATYRPVDSILPGGGYWIKMSSAGKLFLGAIPSSVAREDIWGKPVGGIDPTLVLTLEDALGLSQSLYLTDQVDGGEISTFFDLPPSPPAGMFDARFASNRYIEHYSQPVTRPIRYGIVVAGAAPPVTVRWSLHPDVSEHYSLELVSQGMSRVIPLESPRGRLEIGDPRSWGISLMVEPRRLPVDFVLEPNYPNPFNPVTVLKYQLPVRSKVKLTVFDFLGREVVSLVDAIEEAGLRSVEWAGKDDAGREKAGGVYIYRLTASSLDEPSKSVTLSRRMVLLK